MIKNTVVQYIIIFVIFILGISIVSEWLSNSVIQPFRLKKRVHFQDEFEAFLENLKQEMKREYITKVSHYLESRNFHDSPSCVEHFNVTDSISSPPVYINDSLITPEESKIMAQLNSKINAGTSMSLLDNHASGRKTLGQVYNQIDNDTITYNNLNQHFKTIPYTVKFNEEQKMNIPSKPNYIVDYTHTYTPSVKPEYPYNIPGSSGIAPQEKSYIFDDKYSIKNYQIKPDDPYSSAYKILN